MIVREAVKTDCGHMATVHADSFPAGWPALEIARLVAEPGVLAMVAGERPLAGFILVRRMADEAEILTLAVDPDQRRKGVARALLDAIMSHLLAFGTARLFLEVSENNHAAIQLYSTFGFGEVGRRRRYYADKSDALVMEKSFAR